MPIYVADTDTTLVCAKHWNELLVFEGSVEVALKCLAATNLTVTMWARGSFVGVSVIRVDVTSFVPESSHPFALFVGLIQVSLHKRHRGSSLLSRLSPSKWRAVKHVMRLKKVRTIRLSCLAW